MFRFIAFTFLFLSVSLSFTKSTAIEMTNTAQNQDKDSIVRIDVWSDMVCPFCYVGKKKLEKAIAELDAHQQVKVVWHSFQLDPKMTPEESGLSAGKRLTEQKGITLSQLQGMYANLEQMGEPYGIAFAFDKCITFNTSTAHRIWKYASEIGLDSAWKETVMQAYFCEGKDLSQAQNLIKLAEQIGMKKEAVITAMESEAYDAEVQNDLNLAQQIKISGVPFFIFNQKYAISGAQEDEVFVQTLHKALSGE